jgi:predicted O-methyltransferase YrrM
VPVRRVTAIHEEFDRCVRELVDVAQSIDGYLSPREVRFLALLAACPTADGEILEIGTFRGKSTVVLAQAARLAGDEKVVAVDPFLLAGPAGAHTALADLRATLQRYAVADHVEFHQEYAAGLAREWSRKIRLLWIDGSHTYVAAKSDFELFAPFLSDGAIVALHDVLHVSPGPIRVFMEDVLLSAHFGPAGLCGSIGWGQFFADAQAAWPCRARKMFLYRRLSRLLPYVAFGQKVHGFEKQKYKFLRWRVPHREVRPSEWLKVVRRAKWSPCMPSIQRRGGGQESASSG